MKNFSKIVDNFDVTTKKYVDDGLAEKANSADLATVATSGSYNDLSNKPPIPAAANNGNLTIQKNGTDVATFTANQSTNVTANITVPTKTSELTNDSGYTTNKGTVTQVKINGTTNSPDSAGLVDLGTISGGSSDNSKHGYTELTNESLNTITETGWYRADGSNTCTNKPIASNIPFVLEVEKSTDKYIKQTLYQTGNAYDAYYAYYSAYVRISTNSGKNWYNWYRQQTLSDGYTQTFSARKTFRDGIGISNSLQFSGDAGSNGQFAMSQGSSSAPKWVNLQVKVNGTIYTPDSDGLIDLGEISGGGGSTSQYNDIY